MLTAQYQSRYTIMQTELSRPATLSPTALETLIPPIERPRGLMMKLAYRSTRRQFGKVLAPLKVCFARLPAGFGLFCGKVARLDKKLLLPPQTVLLIRGQVARINVCLF